MPPEWPTPLRRAEPAEPAPDPCSLLQSAELASNYGEQFDDGAEDTEAASAQAGYRSCVWKGADGFLAYTLQTFAGNSDFGVTPEDAYSEAIASVNGPTVPGTVVDVSRLFDGGGGFVAVANGVYLDGRITGVTGAAPPAAADAGTRLLQDAVDALP